MSNGALYVGHVMHMRLIPARHQFRYRVFSLLLDVDRIGATLSGLSLLAHNRFGLMGFHNADHGPRDGGPLRPWVEAKLAQQGLAKPARIELLSFPRILGIGFSPLSVYYCYDSSGAFYAVIYEVKNTFGGQEAYVMGTGPEGGGQYCQEEDKRFFVSPFIGLDQRYRFTLAPPGDKLRLRIKQAGPEGETLIATQTGEARALCDRQLATLFATHPLMSIKVLAAIHWHALRLFLKHVPFHRYSAQRPEFKGETAAKPL